MSSQNNWDNPDMYYQQPQSGPAAGAYSDSNVNYSGAGYGSNAAYGANAYSANSYGANAYSANAYGAHAQFAGPGPATMYQPLSPTNTLSIIALVASIFGVMTSFFLAGIAGIVMGHMARKQIRRTGERGDGMVTAALWVGYAGTIFWLLFWVVYVGIMVLLFGVAMVGAGTVY